MYNPFVVIENIIYSLDEEKETKIRVCIRCYNYFLNNMNINIYEGGGKGSRLTKNMQQQNLLSF